MKKTPLALVVLGLLAVGCGDRDPTGSTAGDELVNPEFASSSVVHRVSVGSLDSDAFGRGVDANFSLVAIQRADGSVTGQWSDQFGHGNGGVHVALDCLLVVGNQAWIGGVATDKNFDGLRVITMVEDNGTSVHDPRDQISFSWVDPASFGFSPNCLDAPDLPLVPITNGEVKVD